MKPLHIFVTLLLFIGSLGAKAPSLSDEATAYEVLFEAINQKRFGLTEATIRAIKDPFIKTYPDANSTEENAQKRETYQLYAIFDNRAKINNTWLMLGETIGTYRLNTIGNREVTLVNPSQTLKLTLSEKGTNNVTISFK